MTDPDFEPLWTTLDGQPVRARRVTVAPAAPRPTVVLLPGLGLSGDYLLGLARCLGPRLPTVVVDLPGSGGCPGPAIPLRPAHLAEVVVRWLDANALSSVVLFDNSFGSQVAAEVAIKRPDLVRALVLGAPTPDATARSFWIHVYRLLRAAVIAPGWLTRLALRDYRRTGFRPLLREGLNALHEPVRDRLGQVSVPTHIVRGDRDPVVSQQWAEEVAGLVGAPLSVVRGAGHGAPAAAPRQVAPIILSAAAAAAE
ncbi:MAG TPA: alpha/beta hydrolase [Mycobacteriales bacterium]|nr:alpha/beta hydrolase [Mycobacteriales bacterium]